MSGPNGFGKTTSFDVCELCLTGKINRSIIKTKITDDTSDYLKVFYRNSREKRDVIVKVLLEKVGVNDVEFLTIVKYLPADYEEKIEGERANKVSSSFDYLDTYIFEEDQINDNNFINSEENKYTNEDSLKKINTFLELENNDLSIDSLYLLFNYLQQEDSLFFLKQSEKERKSSLGFIFNTQDEEDELGEIFKFTKEVKRIKDELSSKISNLKEISAQQVEEIEAQLLQRKEGDYLELFPSKDFNFDSKNVFVNNKSIEECEIDKKQFFEQLKELGYFYHNFSPKDFKVKKMRSELKKYIRNEEFLERLIFSKFLDNNQLTSIQGQKDILDNDAIFKGYILQNFDDDLEILKDKNSNFDFKNNFLQLSTDEQFAKVVDFFQREITAFEKNKKPEKVLQFENLKHEYQTLLNSREDLKISIGSVNRIISDLLDLRRKTKEAFEKLCDERHGILIENCPYCGKGYESADVVLNKFNEKTKYFEELNSENGKKLDKINESLEIVRLDKCAEFKKFVENNNRISDELFSELEKLSHSSDLKLSEYIWKTLRDKTISDLEFDVHKLRNEYKKKNKWSDEMWEKLKLSEGGNIKSQVSFLEENAFIKNLDEFFLSEWHNEVEFYSKKESLKSYLNKKIEEAEYVTSKAEDPNDLFKRYFNEDEEVFNAFDISKIEKKQIYIESEFFSFKVELELRNKERIDDTIALLKKRFQKINSIYEKSESLRKNLDEEIKKYKVRMVERIKIPFFLYSAKIIQNYQQGMGIFIDVKESTSAIRFLTDPSSNHDAMHHLSSGQLAVVAIAFTLSVNKSYNISKNLKFLAIDDPVEEMDSLNIHSFVELMKNEFLKDYQLILSTHDDSNALFIKYKFEKYLPGSTNVLNVQNKFFNSEK